MKGMKYLLAVVLTGSLGLATCGAGKAQNIDEELFRMFDSICLKDYNSWSLIFDQMQAAGLSRVYVNTSKVNNAVITTKMYSKSDDFPRESVIFRLVERLDTNVSRLDCIVSADDVSTDRIVSKIEDVLGGMGKLSSKRSSTTNLVLIVWTLNFRVRQVMLREAPPGTVTITVSTAVDAFAP